MVCDREYLFEREYVNKYRQPAELFLTDGFRPNEKTDILFPTGNII